MISQISPGMPWFSYQNEAHGESLLSMFIQNCIISPIGALGSASVLTKGIYHHFPHQTSRHVQTGIPYPIPISGPGLRDSSWAPGQAKRPEAMPIPWSPRVMASLELRSLLPIHCPGTQWDVWCMPQLQLPNITQRACQGVYPKTVLENLVQFSRANGLRNPPCVEFCGPKQSETTNCSELNCHPRSGSTACKCEDQRKGWNDQDSPWSIMKRLFLKSEASTNDFIFKALVDLWVVVVWCHFPKNSMFSQSFGRLQKPSQTGALYVYV